MMNQSNKEAATYESPQMTTIPIRTSGMLCLSGMGMMSMTPNIEDPALWDFSNSSDNVASEWSSATSDGFGGGWSNFFGE